MAGIRSDHGWFSLTINIQGVEYREPLHTKNRALAEQTRRNLQRQQVRGTFDYAKFFPNSRNLVKLGVAPKGPTPMLAEYALTWLKTKKNLAPGTLAWYRDTIENHIFPADIASMTLDAIKPTDVKLFLTHLKTGPRAINAVIARLRSIFADACADDIIEKNPMVHIQSVREPKTKIDPFTLEEAWHLVASAEGEWEKAFLTVLLFTGMRPNEALALKWEDVDWNRRLISVARTASRWGVHLPKTPGSERDVLMSKPVQDALQDQRSRSQLKSRDGWIFPSEADTPVTLENFRGRNWPRIVRRSGLKYRTIYQCRHTFATIMLAYETVQWVAVQLGHVSIEMVTHHYAKWTRTPEARAAKQFEADVRAAQWAQYKVTADGRQH